MTKDGPLYHQYSDVHYDADRYEFYTPNYKFHWFKVENNVYAAVYDGNRFYELHPDGSQYLIYNSKMHTSGFTARMQGMFRNVTLTIRKMRRANGSSQMKMHYYQYEYVPGSKLAQTREVTAGTVLASRRVKVGIKEGKIFFEAADESAATELVKDNAKYREFNKRLKKLRATLFTQLKLGVYAAEAPLPRHNYYSSANKLKPSIKDELAKCPGIKPDHHNTISWHAIETALVKYVEEWVCTNDAKLLRPIVLCCLHNHQSESADPNDNALRRVKSGLLYAQKQYLRKNCVTIVPSKNSLSQRDEQGDDQDGELLEDAGLREMQVPCEA